MDSDPYLWNADDALLGRDFPLPLDRPFTVAQADAAGVSRRRLAGLHRKAYVRRVLHGVYAAAQAPDNLRTRAAAVALVVPAEGIVTDRTAAWLHGVSILPRTAREQPPPIEVYRRDDSRHRQPGLRSGRRGMLDRDVTEVHGVRVTTGLRTALDLGRLLWRFDALAALDGFLRIGVDHEELVAELARFKGYRGVRQLRPLAAIADGRSESPGESALRLHWYDAGLPAPELQHWVLDDDGTPLFRLDLALPGLRYAGEYDGIEFHSDPDDVQRDDDRRAWLKKHRGWTIDVFVRKNVYGFRSDAAERLTSGVRDARSRLARWTP